MQLPGLHLRHVRCYTRGTERDFVGCDQVRLVCMLLETCGGYFHKGSAARKLDRFLAYFQRYLLAKPPLPLDIDFDVQVGQITASFLVTDVSTTCCSKSGSLESLHISSSGSVHRNQCLKVTLCMEQVPEEIYLINTTRALQD